MNLSFYCLIFFSLLSPCLIADSFKVQSNKLPIEFELMIEHLSKSSEENREIAIGYAYSLEKLFKNFNKQELYLMIKSEIYQTLIYQGAKFEIPSFEVGDFYLGMIQEKKQENTIILSDFQKWFLQSLIDDIAPFIEKPSSATQNRLKIKLKYLKGWLYIFKEQKIEDFNFHLNKVLLLILKQITTKAQIIEKYANFEQPNQSGPYFNFPTNIKDRTEQAPRKDILENINADELAPSKTQVIDQAVQEVTLESKKDWEPQTKEETVIKPEPTPEVQPQSEIPEAKGWQPN